MNILKLDKKMNLIKINRYKEIKSCTESSFEPKKGTLLTSLVIYCTMRNSGGVPSSITPSSRKDNLLHRYSLQASL